MTGYIPFVPRTADRNELQIIASGREHRRCNENELQCDSTVEKFTGEKAYCMKVTVARLCSSSSGHATVQRVKRASERTLPHRNATGVSGAENAP